MAFHKPAALRPLPAKLKAYENNNRKKINKKQFTKDFALRQMNILLLQDVKSTKNANLVFYLSNISRPSYVLFLFNDRFNYISMYL